MASFIRQILNKSRATILFITGKTTTATINVTDDDVFSAKLNNYEFLKDDGLNTTLPRLNLSIADLNNITIVPPIAQGSILYWDTTEEKWLVVDINADGAWDDIRVPITSTKLGGSKDPHFIVFKTDGSGSQGVFAYAFDKTSEEELYFTVQLPHDYELGTDLHPHVHWGVKASVPGSTTVRWGLEYTIANIDDVFGNTTIIYTTATDPVTQFAHIVTEFNDDVSGTAIDNVSTMLLCRIFRDIANDNFDDDAFLFEIDFHYQRDDLGSTSEYIK